MAVLQLPTRTDGVRDYAFTTDLDGSSYLLRLRWNERDPAWYMDVSDASGNLLRAGIKVVVSWPLTARFIDPAMPPGEFWAIDTSRAGEDPGLLDLGARVTLVYEEKGT